MADEQQNQSSENKPKRRRKRRSSRRRRQRKSAKTADTQPQQESGNPKNSQEPPKKRRRRRRRSRSRKSSNNQRNNAPVKDPLDAKLPESVFVYTHVVHSSALDTYGYRSDPFMSNSRNLSDFRIDLSTVFPEGMPDEDDRDKPVYDSALHSPINAHVGRADASSQHDDAGPANDEAAGEHADADNVHSSEILDEVQQAVDERMDDSNSNK